MAEFPQLEPQNFAGPVATFDTNHGAIKISCLLIWRQKRLKILQPMLKMATIMVVFFIGLSATS